MENQNWVDDETLNSPSVVQLYAYIFNCVFEILFLARVKDKEYLMENRRYIYIFALLRRRRRSNAKI